MENLLTLSLLLLSVLNNSEAGNGYKDISLKLHIAGKVYKDRVKKISLSGVLQGERDEGIQKKGLK